MTRENLVEAIIKNNDNWSCPDSGTCEKPGAESCQECAEKLLEEYENNIINCTIREMVERSKSHPGENSINLAAAEMLRR